MRLTWKTERRKMSELKTWEENPRTIDESSFKDLKDSMEQDGDWGVLVIDIDGTVISGNQRLNSGETEFDVKVPDRKLTEKEKRRIALRANRTKGKDNFDILANWDKEDLMEGWLSEEEIMMKIGLNESEGQYVDEDRFNVLMVMPPNSPVLKERVNLECGSLEEYLRIKKYVEESGSEQLIQMILANI